MFFVFYRVHLTLVLASCKATNGSSKTATEQQQTKVPKVTLCFWGSGKTARVRAGLVDKQIARDTSQVEKSKFTQSGIHQVAS